MKKRKDNTTLAEEILPVMTIEEARKVLQVSPTRMKQLIDGRKLKTVRTEGGHRLVKSASVHARNADPAVRSQRERLKKTPA